MLSVLGVIGKIIGFTLLGILGLILLILLIALFVPLRYKVDANGGKFEDGVRVDAKGGASYLLHIISVKGGFLKTPEGDTREGADSDEKEGVSVCARLFGIQVFPKKEKKGKKKEDEADSAASEDFEEAEVLEVITAEGPKEEAPKEEAPQEEAGHTAADSTGTQDLTTEETPPIGEVLSEPFDENDWKDDISLDDLMGLAPEAPEDGSEEKEKKSLSEKLENIRQKGEDLADKLEALKAKADKVLDFVTDNTTQEEFALILKRLGKALKHYIPKKFEGYARVGLSDPATTGKILMYWYSIAYPRIPDTFRLIGEFDEEVIEGDAHIKGHLRLNHIVWFGIKMLLDKRFRKLIKRGKKLMKELKGSGSEADGDETDDEESKRDRKTKKSKDNRNNKDGNNETAKEEE